MKSYDITLIGSGPGGYVAAIKAAQLGKKVAIVEKDSIGGVCLNWGCIPTKALLSSAKVYKNFQNAKDFGIDVEKDSFSVNFKKMMQRKNKVVKKLTGGVGYLLKKNEVDVYNGLGEAVDSNTVKVGDETFKTEKLIVATGASPFVPPVDGLEKGLDDDSVLTAKTILDLKEQPKSLTIIGGGVIGVEFATIFATLGTKVTIIELQEDVLLPVDEELREPFKKVMKKQKINVLTSAQAKKVDGGKLTYVLDGKEETIAADKILLATGMKGNLKGLDALNLATEKGFIKTDEYLRTNVDNVYAIGDVNGKEMLAHVASKEGLTAVGHIIDGEKTHPMDYTKVPSGIYTFPEIAQVGLTEKAAKEKGIDIKVSTFPLSANGKALAEGQSVGLVKMIADKKYNEIIGVHILSDNATDLITEAVLGMNLEATAEDYVHAIHPHPTLSEMLHETAHGIIDKPIHI